MPRKIKIINENVEEIESLEKSPPPPEKVKKPRSEKQIQAFNAMIEKKKSKSVEIPKEDIHEPETEPEQEPEPAEEMAPKKKRGRPQLTPEKLEQKQSMKEVELKKQLEKLEKKIEMTAKQEAKKKVLTKIKQKLDEVNDSDDDNGSDSDDDNAINQIIARHKKPIVIVNKIDGGPKKRKPIHEQHQPTAYFI